MKSFHQNDHPRAQKKYDQFTIKKFTFCKIVNKALKLIYLWGVCDLFETPSGDN